MNELNPYSTPKMMTPEEARKRVNTINASMNNIRVLLLDFHDREGWKALGYESWTDCVEKEFEQGRRQIFRQFQAAQIEQNINDSAKTECQDDTIPEAQLRPLAAVAPEDQPTVYQLAKETAPEGKLTAAHVEKTVREIKGDSLKTYRIRDIATNEWWEGEAKTPEEACEVAWGNSFGSSKAKWNVEGCDIKEKTFNGAGGWKKVNQSGEKTASTKTVDCQGCPDHRGMINKHPGVKVPGNSGKCIRPGGPCEKARVGSPTHQDPPAPPLSDAGDGVGTGVPYFTDLAIRAIDKIKDDDPGCKAALAKIAVHVWNRQQKIKAA